ncbi:hypothetical protein [Rubritalea tangerina]
MMFCHGVGHFLWVESVMCAWWAQKSRRVNCGSFLSVERVEGIEPS